MDYVGYNGGEEVVGPERDGWPCWTRSLVPHVRERGFLVLEVRFFVKSLEIIATWCFLLLSSHFNQSQRLNSHSELFAETRHLRQ